MDSGFRRNDEKSMPAKDRLKTYREKRDFTKTGEPAGEVGAQRKAGGSATSSRSTTRRGCISISGWS